MPLLDLNDIQANVVAPLPATRAIHVLARLPAEPDAERRRRFGEFVGSMADRVTRAAEASQYTLDHTVNLGLSARALSVLGLDKEASADLPVAFREGMRLRARRVGDVDGSDPVHWDLKLRDPDVVATVATLEPTTKRPRPRRSPSGPSADEVAAELLGDMMCVGRPRVQRARQYLVEGGRGEWFGWRDGITNPAVEGSGRPMRPGDGVVWRPDKKKDPNRLEWRAVRAGEFVHGYVDENGTVAMSPRLRTYLRNGTFMVWRKLRQHVDEFHAHVRPLADGGDRIIGRRKNGDPLFDDRAANDFIYPDDEAGVDAVCPATAHIRRANPRNAIDFAEEIMPRHRIMRWGMPYGEEGRERGLIFICFNADIERQYEFIQARWLNANRELRVNETTDVLTGTVGREAPGGLRPFVTTLGGEYFLVPGVNALRALGRLAQETTA